MIGKCDIIIAVDIRPIEKIEKIEGVPEIIVRTFQMSVGIQKDIKESCDLVIQLDELSGYNILDTHHNEDIFELGYNYVKNLDVSKIRKMIG